MSSSKVIVYGLNTFTGMYTPIPVTASGFTVNGHVLTITDATTVLYGALETENFNLGFNGATWDRARLPTVFKTASTNGTSAVVWTPAAGKRIRLMGYSISGNATAAAATSFTVLLIRPSGIFMQHTCVASATLAHVIETTVDMKQGVLLNVDDQISFSLSNSGLLTFGAFGVNLWGTEE